MMGSAGLLTTVTFQAYHPEQAVK